MYVQVSSAVAPARLRPVTLAIHLAFAGLILGTLAAPAPVHAADAPTVAARARYDIPGGPLGSVLTRFAAEAGVELSFVPDLTAQRLSAGLHGDYTIDEGFAALLAGSGLEALRAHARGYTLAIRQAAAEPPPAAQTNEGAGSALPQIRVNAKRESLGTTVIDRAAIDALPTGNGDVTSLLKVHPNVQFSNEQLASGTQGEIAPADISINGAKFYDNRYQMDGMAFNNDLDPANDNANDNASPPSAIQGFAIDTSLLCKVTVRDSNVGAEYGGFTGGVVAADTCAPTRDFGGQFSVETTRSSWMHYKIDPRQQAAYENSTSQDLEPEFEKWTYRLALEGKPAESVGLIGSVVRKTSEIPLTAYTNGMQSGADASRKTEKRASDNFFVRGFWTPTTEVAADLSLLYAPTHDRHFIANARNSYFEIDQGGYGLNAGLTHTVGSGLVLEHRLVANRMESSRDADASVWKLWRYSADKNWGSPTGNSGEGGYGDIDQRQDSANYTLKAQAKPLTLGGIGHNLRGGIELGDQRSFYERTTRYEQYTGSTNTTTCTLANGSLDTETCSLATPYNAASGGQYLKNRIIYFAGKFEVSNQTRALYLEDEMQIERLQLRLGARYEDDNLAPEGTWSPRVAALIDTFADGNTLIELGANRYYGRNFMRYRTYAERLSLQTGSQSRTVSGGVLGTWADPVRSNTSAMYHLGDLKVPYSDEAMAGISQKAFNTLWTLKYVKRASRDEVVLLLRSSGNYWWDNVGHTNAETWTLSAQTLEPLVMGGTRTTLGAALDRTSVDTSFADYADTLSNLSGDLDRYIRYDGKFMRYLDRPADNYNRPWTLRLLASTEVPAWKLNIDHLLRLRQSYERMASTGEEVPYGDGTADVYEKTKFGTAITWDLRLGWRLPTARGQEAFLSFTIENLLDRANVIDETSSAIVYEKGRQFWLQLGYKF